MPPPLHSPLQVYSFSRVVLPKWPAAHLFGQPVKFIGGKVSGDFGTHKPRGQWMTVSSPKTSIVPDGHEDSDEAKDVFRRVREPLEYNVALEL